MKRMRMLAACSLLLTAFPALAQPEEAPMIGMMGAEVMGSGPMGNGMMGPGMMMASEKPENRSKSWARNRHYLLFRAEGLSVITPAPIPLIEAAFS